MCGLIFSDVKLNINKIIMFSISGIYGLGLSKAIYICYFLGLKPFYPMKSLSYYHYLIMTILFRQFYVTSTDLKNQCFLNLKKLIDCFSYRGLRYITQLPMSGQRTSTNAKTSKKRKLYDLHFIELTKDLKFLKKKSKGKKKIIKLKK